MIVVADTGPLNYLIQIKYDSLLQALFSRVVIPKAVLLELAHDAAPRIVLDWATNLPTWVESRRASASDDPYLQNLGDGEREAILLAEELSANLLLMDERRGRAEAARRRLRAMGTLGVLAQADRRGLVDAPDAYRRLISETNFRTTPRLERDFLKLLAST
jgi:predicted nucleic acid-binding protein